VLVVPTFLLVDVRKVVFVEVALEELVDELVQVYTPAEFSHGGRHWEKKALYLLQTCGGGHRVGPAKVVN
jgi:hypothetical protein